MPFGEGRKQCDDGMGVSAFYDLGREIAAELGNGENKSTINTIDAYMASQVIKLQKWGTNGQSTVISINAYYCLPCLIYSSTLMQIIHRSSRPALPCDMRGGRERERGRVRILWVASPSHWLGCLSQPIETRHLHSYFCPVDGLKHWFASLGHLTNRFFLYPAP